MAYISLYRKYRPKRFLDVIGQEIVVKTLINSVKYNKICHAYIFNGPRGTGKTSIAKIFAKAVNCENFNNDICEKCDNCITKSEELIDIIELDAASNNSVDDIRDIVNNVKLMPSKLKYKVYIIDEVHMLSTSAFNALLKTLEEPPNHVIFILATTEINKIPATVLSRCQKFNFSKINPNLISKRLKYILKKEKKYIDDSVIDLISNLSDGGLRDAINLLDQILSLNNENITVDDVYNIIGSVSNNEVFELIDNILFPNIKNMLIKINYIFEKNLNLNIIGERIEQIIKDIIIYNSTDNYFSEEYESYLKKYTKIDIELLIKSSEILIELNYNLKKGYDQKNIFEIYLIKIIMIFNKENDSNNELSTVNNNVIENKDTKITNNLPDINEKNILINNALSMADKKLKNDFLKKFNFESYLTNKNYINLINLLVKSKVEVVSEKNLIFTFKENHDVLIFDSNIAEISNFLKNIYKKKYEIVAIDNNKWEIIKNKYIEDIKKGIKYEYIDQKKSLKIKNTSELEKNVENIFGEDIIKDI